MRYFSNKRLEDKSHEDYLNDIVQAPVLSFQRREKYHQWKKERPALSAPAVESSKLLKDLDSAQTFGKISDGLYSATFYQYLYSCGCILFLSGGVFTMLQSHKSRWFLCATPLLFTHAYLSYAKYEEAMEDINYLDKRKKLRNQCK